jgi:hypothetical protein
VIEKPPSRSVVQAQPGWSVVVPEDNGKELYRMPVIAWLFEVHERQIGDSIPEGFVTVTPVTCTGSVEDVQDYALQFGAHGPFYAHFENYDDETALWAHFHQEERRRSIARGRRS